LNCAYLCSPFVGPPEFPVVVVQGQSYGLVGVTAK
jgi:hypothetical protein